MNEWEKLETEKEAKEAVQALREGRPVTLTYPGKDANVVNDVKEALGNLYRLTFNEEIQISSMTRDENGILYIIFERKEKDSE